MPTYEYRCPECGHVQELWGVPAALRDEQEVICNATAAHPETGAPVQCERMVSRSTGMALKGGGWYADGYHGRTSPNTSES